MEKNTLKSVNKTDQRAGIVVAYTFFPKESGRWLESRIYLIKATQDSEWEKLRWDLGYWDVEWPQMIIGFCVLLKQEFY